VAQTADVAAAALSMTDRRRSTVVFLKPAFMTFDMAMLMKKGNVSKAFQSFDDLNVGGVTNYRIGVVDGGSSGWFFRRSRYYYAWDKISRSGFVRNVEEGVRLVRESNDSHPYIFIGEKPMLDYHASQQPCDLVVVKGNSTDYGGRLLRPGEYHLAVGRGVRWDIRNKLEAALSKLNETGRLQALYNKWWIERSQCTTAVTPEATTIGAPITEATTTGAPVIETTTEAPNIETTTGAAIAEETTTEAPNIETTTEAAVAEETTTEAPIAQEPPARYH